MDITWYNKKDRIASLFQLQAAITEINQHYTYHLLSGSTVLEWVFWITINNVFNIIITVNNEPCCIRLSLEYACTQQVSSFIKVCNFISFYP